MKATKTVSSNNPGTASAAPAGGPPYLQRPRFFRDQLLTDQDLGALTDWVQGKLALGRLRHGWGVVCGLEVHCDPKSPGNLIVGPGYAIDGAGQDIVVAEDSDPLDLSAKCLPQSGPCAPPAAAGYGDSEGTSFGVSAGEVSAFDLYIAYAETGADARHVPRRGACKETAGCEYAREVEKYKLDVRPVAPAAAAASPAYDPNKAWPAYEQWRTDAHALVKDVVALFSQIASKLKDLQDRLSSWIATSNRPPYQLGFLADRIAGLTTGSTEGDVAKLVFALLQDGRARLLTCTCPAVPADTSVLLARFWLQAKQDTQGRLSCQVIAIDSQPPNRHPLRLKSCWPAPAKEVNLGRWLWAPLDDPTFNLTATLAEWDLTAPAPTEVAYTVGDGGTFNAVIDAPLIVARKTTFTGVKYLDMGAPLGKRIVAFLT
jgi:hypothetical protein